MSEIRRRVQTELSSREIPADLRHMDDPDVACLAAVGHAIATLGIDSASFRDWGIIAAPQPPTRIKLASVHLRFHNDGPTRLSPHIIPERSLQSLSSLVNAAHGFGGPNFGVGGATGRESDLWTALIAFDAAAILPGAWILLNGISNDGICRAAAMAICFRQRAGEAEITIRFGCTDGEALTPRFTLESFDRVLSLPVSPLSFCRWSLNGGGIVEWRPRQVAMKSAA